MARMRTGMSGRQVQQLSLTPGMRQALHLLRMSNLDLAQFLHEQAAQNPWLSLDGPATAGQAGPALGLPRGAARAPAGARAGASSGGAGFPGGEDNFAAPGPSLIGHVTGWIAQHFAAGPEQEAAMLFAEALEPSGWLGSGTGAIAATTGLDAAACAAVLRRLQGIDPPGLFASDLRECLWLQAAEAGLLDPVMQVVLDHLDMVATGDLARLARLASVPPDRIADVIGVIRGFDPKPGAAFGADAAQIGPPDLVVLRQGEGWTVALNEAGLPGVSLREGAPAGDPVLAAARQIAQMVARRNATLLRIAQDVADWQSESLERGPGHLRPLRRFEVAARLGLHESTVSRAVAAVRIVTPQGTVPLARFFPAALAGDVSAASAKAAIRRHVAAEAPARPLSDARLAGLLEAEGITLARRTVAKYREELRILPAARRRRAAPLP